MCIRDRSRDWLPNPIGGIVWLAWDNVAASVYSPLYCGIIDVPASFKEPGRTKGYNRNSAWWAFNRLSTLAAQRWGDMRHDLEAVWQPMQSELFANQVNFERTALELYRDDSYKLKEYLTEYSMKWADKIVKRGWKLGDELWTKYDEKF